MSANINQVAEDMFKMVEKDRGTKKYKPGDLFKAMMTNYKSEGLSKKDCKSAIRILIDSERLNYTYFNGTFVEIPGIEGAAMAAEEAARHDWNPGFSNNDKVTFIGSIKSRGTGEELKKYSLMLFIALVAYSCSAKPVFYNGRYYMMGDRDCRQFAGVSKDQIMCYASDGVETEYRYALPNQQKQRENREQRNPSGLNRDSNPNFYKQQRKDSNKKSCVTNRKTGQCY